MKVGRRIEAIFDFVIDAAYWLAAIMLAYTGISIAISVFTRYFLNIGLGWTIEVSEYCLLFMCFLASARLLKQEGHVKIDVLINRLSPKNQIRMNIITSIIGVIVFLIIAWYAGQRTWMDLQAGYMLPTVLAPHRAIMNGMICVGTFLLAVQFVRRAQSPPKAHRLLG